MNSEDAGPIINQLRDQLKFHNEEYYQKGNSSIDDDQFDLMLEQLTDLEKRFPQFSHPDSPSQRVGGGPIDSFESSPHTKTDAEPGQCLHN